MARPRIGVTGNDKRLSPSWICIRLSVWLAGGRALRISTRHGVDCDTLDGMIISGGDDIHPSLYQSDPMPEAYYDPDRDELEKNHIAYALDNGLPLLGICRGFQLINVVRGGRLIQDIRALRSRTSNRGTIFARKIVKLDSGSRLQRLLERSTIRVNSLHSQAVDKPGAGLEPSGYDLDGFIQGGESTDHHRIIGTQWHPEYLFYLPAHRRIFRWIVDAARDGGGAGGA